MAGGGAVVRFHNMEFVFLAMVCTPEGNAIFAAKALSKVPLFHFESCPKMFTLLLLTIYVSAHLVFPSKRNFLLNDQDAVCMDERHVLKMMEMYYKPLRMSGRL